MTWRVERSGVMAVGLVAILATSPARTNAGQGAGGGVSAGATDIGGVVTSSKGPEAGVWVIAETRDLPTKYIKIVVTDDRGRYLLPDLPKATYELWVRGYGLVDGPKQKGQPGKLVNLSATVAPSAKAAASHQILDTLKQQVDRVAQLCP